MSKIAELITAKVTGDVKTVQSLNMKYAEVRKDTIELEFGTRRAYRIGVTLSHEAYVDEPYRGEDNKADVQYAIETVRRAFIEEIFGEFRPILRELSVATYDKDTNRVRTLLAELDMKMFREGL